LPDGRTLQARREGDSAARPLVYHVGTPHGITPEPEVVAAATTRGLQLITIARPGYQGSSEQLGRSVADAAEDTLAIMEALGQKEFLTLGWSGGGPHALACAALLDGCLAATAIASIAPPDAEGLPLLAGMGAENVEEFGVAMQGSEPLTAWLRDAAERFASVSGDQLFAEFGTLLPPADRAALSGERANFIAASFAEALAAGVAGWRDDDLAFLQPWGFDLGAIVKPVAVWQGSEDLMSPPAHGAWLSQAIPGCRAHLLDGEGHLSVGLDRLGEIVDELVAMAE
jgi:pimeloyl-ACP methyl ester carboxylesterase